MTTRRQWRDFLRLNPEYTWQAEQQGLEQFRPTALSRELGTTVAWALVDENHGSPRLRVAAIAERATLAQQRAQARQRTGAER
jgi:uncharacterized protein YndB with AHSA1/START domain